jgi:hypothetical protein
MLTMLLLFLFLVLCFKNKNKHKTKTKTININEVRSSGAVQWARAPGVGYPAVTAVFQMVVYAWCLHLAPAAAAAASRSFPIGGVYRRLRVVYFAAECYCCCLLGCSSNEPIGWQLFWVRRH